MEGVQPKQAAQVRLAFQEADPESTGCADPEVTSDFNAQRTDSCFDFETASQGTQWLVIVSLFMNGTFFFHVLFVVFRVRRPGNKAS